MKDEGGLALLHKYIEEPILSSQLCKSFFNNISIGKSTFGKLILTLPKFETCWE